MKIALVGPTPPPNGGMAMQTLQLQQLLQQRGHQVTLISVNAPYRPAIAGKIPVLRALFRLLPYLFRLMIDLRKHDVVHLMANSGWAWYLFCAPAIHIAHLFGVPCVVNYRGGLANDFLQTAASRVRFSMKRVQRLVVPSGFLQQVFGNYAIEAEIVPNIVNLELFRYREPQPIGKAPHLVVTRNLEALYGNRYAIEALAKLSQIYPDSRMTLAGDGPDRPALEQLVNDLGLSERVRFSGRLERQQIADLYAEADILLNPTTADNMPNSLLEAMACGVPVITTNVGGIPFMVEDQHTALLVSPRDSEALANAVDQLIQSPALVEKLSRNAREQVGNYHPGTVLPRWEQCYNQMREAC
ncbi:glycosyltransferase family 4 protein [Motiliproteus sp.]|uniref:glycosyltransferase family 4 protein n=1 Tax=Motiliproteus sp. TaxID=1898955 RepID=UPI003BAB6E69